MVVISNWRLFFIFIQPFPVAFFQKIFHGFIFVQGLEMYVSSNFFHCCHDVAESPRVGRLTKLSNIPVRMILGWETCYTHCSDALTKMKKKKLWNEFPIFIENKTIFFLIIKFNNINYMKGGAREQGCIK